MSKFNVEKFLNNVFAFSVGAAIGSAIITPFVIRRESEEIKNAINLNTYGFCYPEELRRDIEERLNKSKNTEN